MTPRDTIPEEIRQEADIRRDRAPDRITREWLEEQCERLEKVLRLQDEAEDSPFELTDRDEAELSRRPTSTTTGALKRWAYLKHLYLVRSESGGHRGAIQASGVPGSDAEEAARKLLQREPVEVDLGTRRVQITGRSYACMLSMAQHESRIDELGADLERVQELRSDLEDEIRDHAGRALHLRRRFKKLGKIQRLLLAEIRLHRQMLYAHAFTDDGAPASSLSEAPDWWREIDQGQDAKILMGLFQAGPGRLMQLGEPPESDSKSEKKEDWGYKSLIASIERQQKVDPAAYFKEDLFQLIAWVRAGAPPVPEALDS